MNEEVRLQHNPECNEEMGRLLHGMEFGDSLRAAEDRKRWKCIGVTSSVVP